MKKGTAEETGSREYSFVPGTAGLMIAGEVVRDLIKKSGKK